MELEGGRRGLVYFPPLLSAPHHDDAVGQKGALQLRQAVVGKRTVVVRRLDYLHSQIESRIQDSSCGVSKMIA